MEDEKKVESDVAEEVETDGAKDALHSVEEALVERGDISSMVHPEDIGSSPSSAPTWIIFDFSTNENHFF